MPFNNEIITGWIVPVLVAIGSGAIGSLIAPWVHWGIEKKKLKLDGRRKLIERARQIVSLRKFNVFIFRQSTEFHQLFEYFSENAINQIGIDDDYMDIKERGYPDIDLENRSLIYNELNRIAKEWKLE